MTLRIGTIALLLEMFFSEVLTYQWALNTNNDRKQGRVGKRRVGKRRVGKGRVGIIALLLQMIFSELLTYQWALNTNNDRKQGKVCKCVRVELLYAQRKIHVTTSTCTNLYSRVSNPCLNFFYLQQHMYSCHT